MRIENLKSVFQPVTITLTSGREVEILLALLLLADNKNSSEVDWCNVFKQHNICNLGNLLSTDEMDNLSRTLGNLLAALNKNLGR